MMAERHPRVSRETRRLFLTVVLAVAALWGLARLRFPNRPPPPPVPSVLAPFIPSSPLEAIAGMVHQVEGTVLGGVVPVAAPSVADDAGRPPNAIAFRFREDTAVGIPSQMSAFGGTRDRVTGVAIYAVSAASPPALPRWQPRPTGGFFFAADPAGGGTALRPLFIGDLEPLVTAVWPQGVWAVPRDVDLPIGTLLFTPEGAWAGAVAQANGRTVLVPSDALTTIANDLLARGDVSPGVLGVDVQPLTPAVARALGVDLGVVVTAVDRNGPAARQLAVMDVIDQVNGHAIDSWDAWLIATGRIHAGERVALSIRRHGPRPSSDHAGTAGSTDAATTPRVVEIDAVAPLAAGREPGLIVRAGARGLTEVVHVEPGSPSERAGLHAGDVIERIGTIERPSPQQTRQLVSGSGAGRGLAIAVERDGRTIVLALETTK
jgi:hypothetical protein